MTCNSSVQKARRLDKVYMAATFLSRWQCSAGYYAFNSLHT